MNPIEGPIQVLIQGATGNLGLHIVNHALLNSRLKVNVITRDTSMRPDIADKVEAAGGIVMRGDLGDIESLRNVTEGMHTVICTISSGEDMSCLDGQMALIDDCVKNGVKLFVPSCFSINHDELSREELVGCPMTAYKERINDYLKTVHLPSLRIYVGVMMEEMFNILRESHCYWGDENLKHELTCFENAARLTVHAVAKMDCTGEVVYCGGSYTIKQIQDIYNKVRGTNVQFKRAGSLEDLRRFIELNKMQGDVKAVNCLKLQAMIFDERSKFQVKNSNEFEEVKPVGLEEFLRANPKVML